MENKELEKKELSPLELENQKLKDELKLLQDKSQEKILTKENNELKIQIKEIKELFNPPITDKSEKIEVVKPVKKEPEIDENWVPTAYRTNEKKE